jgi:hypothetical protein
MGWADFLVRERCRRLPGFFFAFSLAMQLPGCAINASRHVAALLCVVSESRGFGRKPWLAGVYQTSAGSRSNGCETRRGVRSRWPRSGHARGDLGRVEAQLAAISLALALATQ